MYLGCLCIPRLKYSPVCSVVNRYLKSVVQHTLYMQYSAALFVDIAKAFDVIVHNLLIKKLELYKLSNYPIQLLKSFLSKQTQRVAVKDHSNI